MNESIAGAIPRLAALAAQGLSWRPHDFWSATPPELALCLADPSGNHSEGVTREDIDRMTAQDTNERRPNG